jgi:hypothetical protein
MKNNDVTIKDAVISDITITGPTHLKDEISYRHFYAKQKAIFYGGKILREEKFDDGFFLEVAFKEDADMSLWKKEIGLK